jgi:FlaA1/EpsC-like NDP-sugar epimerase
LQGGQSGKLNPSQISSFHHQEFEIMELDQQIEESQRRLKVMQDLDNALTRYSLFQVMHFTEVCFKTPYLMDLKSNFVPLHR